MDNINEDENLKNSNNEERRDIALNKTGLMGQATMNNMNEDENPESSNSEVKRDISFKKPILIGKIGRFPRKMSQPKVSDINGQEETIDTQMQCETSNITQQIVEDPKPKKSPTKLVRASACSISENNIPLPYKEPVWSGLPNTNGRDYIFEVLKNGTIIETVNLMEKSFWVFGRLASCDICMQHPTISRYHAVLQYRSESTETEGSGFYIYDLGSTHGTFLNKNRLKPKIYARVQVGHILKLGCSTRSYILNGPDDDVEEESELTVTELKKKRVEDLLKREEEIKEAERELEEKRKKEEERGIDWGLGEDADEETDLSENPYAQTSNEELYLDDPKKALRGFFEREGLDLHYDCKEAGIGQFFCKVVLPIDDEQGRPIEAVVVHKGKKKEAVVQCALEACRMLDRHGVLRQATHESRKRKAKNWEENDYYDSDDDTFLDRTGTIEKKRVKRMNSKVPQKAETYESLLEKEKAIAASISNLEKQLANVHEKNNSNNGAENEEDSLDSYMKELKESRPDKQMISKLKLEVTKMKGEHANIIRMVNIAKPASLPPLETQYVSVPGTSKDTKNTLLPIIGQRNKSRVQLPVKVASEQSSSSRDAAIEEEVEEEEEEDEDSENTVVEVKYHDETERILNTFKQLMSDVDRMLIDWKLLDAKKVKLKRLMMGLLLFLEDHKLAHKAHLEMRRMAAEFDELTEQKLKLTDVSNQIRTEMENITETLRKEFAEYKKTKRINKITEDVEESKKDTVNSDRQTDVDTSSDDKLDTKITITNLELSDSGKIQNSSSNIVCTKDDQGSSGKTETENTEKASTSSDSSKIQTSAEDDPCSGDKPETEEKKKKKNQRRIQQRQERAEIERQKGYEEDALREDYSMWVPPTDQSGDGRTSLNDKLGY